MVLSCLKGALCSTLKDFSKCSEWISQIRVLTCKIWAQKFTRIFRKNRTLKEVQKNSMRKVCMCFDRRSKKKTWKQTDQLFLEFCRLYHFFMLFLFIVDIFNRGVCVCKSISKIYISSRSLSESGHMVRIYYIRQGSLRKTSHLVTIQSYDRHPKLLTTLFQS